MWSHPFLEKHVHAGQNPCAAKLTRVLKQREVGRESEHVNDLTVQIDLLAGLFRECWHFLIVALDVGQYSDECWLQLLEISDGITQCGAFRPRPVSWPPLGPHSLLPMELCA